MSETDYGADVGEFGKWWTNCGDCGAGITVTAEETPTLPDPEDWDWSGSLSCPVCGGRTTGWNGDLR